MHGNNISRQLSTLGSTCVLKEGKPRTKITNSKKTQQALKEFKQTFKRMSEKRSGEEQSLRLDMENIAKKMELDM